MLKYLKQIKKKDILNFFSLIVAILIWLLFTYITGIGCPIRFISGISCPGCGMTRAIYSMLKGDFIASLYYHPLIFLLPVILFLLFKPETKKKWKIDKILWRIVAALFLIVYLLRLLSHSDAVQINISEGFVYRIIHEFRK